MLSILDYVLCTERVAPSSPNVMSESEPLPSSNYEEVVVEIELQVCSIEGECISPLFCRKFPEKEKIMDDQDVDPPHIRPFLPAFLYCDITFSSYVTLSVFNFVFLPLFCSRFLKYSIFTLACV